MGTNRKLHSSLTGIPMPPQIEELPRTEAGWPELFFAGDYEGKKDLRVMDPKKWSVCVRRRLCWVCGHPLGVYLAWPIGPMCVVNRVSSEPPSHRMCAEYSVRACPFLSRPHMERRPIEGAQMAGFGIMRNPGAVAIWIAKDYKIFQAGGGNHGQLINLGEPVEVHWYSAGRQAEPVEVWESIDSGLPILRASAAKEGKYAINELEKYIKKAMAWLPARPEGLLDV